MRAKGVNGDESAAHRTSLRAEAASRPLPPSRFRIESDRREAVPLPCRPPTCVIRCLPLKSSDRGEVREWTNRHAWKACVSATGPWVRIPPSPPSNVPCKIGKACESNSHCQVRRWDSNEGGSRGRHSPAWGDTRGQARSVGARTRDSECSPSPPSVSAVSGQA